MYIIMGPSAIWAGPCRVLVTHVGSLWGCEQGWAMWVKQCHVYRPWLAMVYTTHKSGDDWGDCLLLFYPHYRFSNVAVEDGPCIADDLWWLRKYDFSMATQNYQRVLGCTGNLSGYNGIFMMCSTFWYQPTVWEHRIKCAMFRYVKLPLGSIPTGWGPQIAQLRYGCGWFLWFMIYGRYNELVTMGF